MSDIPRALFEVGEEVVVVPGHNIPAFSSKIIRMHTRGCPRVDSPTQKWFYRLSPDPFDQGGDNHFESWSESKLRKKPKLGDSYDQLLANLKNPSCVQEPV